MVRTGEPPMPSQFDGRNGELLVSGLSWGERNFGPISQRERDRMLYRELIESGVLPADALPPSKRHRRHVTLVVMHSSRHEGRWVLDEPVPETIREIIRDATMPADYGMAPG
jgi:hypothetical protein